MKRQKEQMMKETEKVAVENEVRTSNGNKEKLAETKPGGAERGGPGRSAARDEQPPHASRTQIRDR